ncbi:hypothetical protein TrVFT333_001058 [Trichoderma virens FT-333]|nr:hypothetical protein TrVFT333_001058 [Trichoderma virens FT-333]
MTVFTKDQLPSDGSSEWSLRAKAFLVVCSHRMWRGGPRSILQITATAFVLLMLFYFVPLQLDDRYQHILNWSAPESATSGGDLRIVVFGSQDLMGSAPDAKHTYTSWPEHLCKQLKCHSVLSFVPPIESQPGLTSNSIYGTEIRALEMFNEQANITEKPALDNFYIPEQYPVPTKTPDLGAQVQRFLTMSPKIPPRETLWVFTFGTWETWNMASLPRETGERLIDASVADIFTQVELLYRKSLNPKSPAFSDFWSNFTKEEIKALTHPDPANKPDERKMESFRVVIPQLFDITLAPGWQNRPFLLTRTRGAQMEFWRRKGDSKPEGIEEEGIDTASSIPTMSSLLRYLPESLQPQEKNNTGEAANDDFIYAPYPRRLGFQTTLAKSVLDAMMEEEMQRSGLRDSKGRGSRPANDVMRFLDVWTPCISNARAVTGVSTSQPSQECEVPNDHLFYDEFTFGERAREELAKQTSDQIRQYLFAS